MIIKRIPAGIYAANCYIVASEITKDALVLDPGGDEDFIINEIEKQGYNPKAILLTHGHIDHVGAVKALAEKYKIKTYLNHKDLTLMRKGAYIYGDVENVEVQNIEDKDTYSFGDLKVLCIGTPGHSPGGMSLLIENSIFTGDTLFKGSIGRTDLEGGDYDTLIRSIIEKLMPLDNEIVVYPGHGPSTTIHQERYTNPFIN